jgi:hypothetical protein
MLIPEPPFCRVASRAGVCIVRPRLAGGLRELETLLCPTLL